MTPVTTRSCSTAAVDKLKAEIERQGGANAAGLELPEAHIRGDVNTPYRCIGGTIYTMQQAGFARSASSPSRRPADGDADPRRARLRSSLTWQ